MRLLILDSAARAEDLAERLRNGERCDVVRSEPGSLELARTSGTESGGANRLRAVPDALEDRDVALLRPSALAENPDLGSWLERQRARGMAVVLLLGSIAELDQLEPTVRALGDDFALDAATPEELLARARRSRQLRADHLTQAQEIADASIRRAFASKVLHAQEAERHLLSRELHDGIGQMMMCHLMDADFLASQAGNGPLRELAEQLCKSLGGTLESVRDLALDLRPPAIDELGIVASLDSLVTTLGRRSGLRFEYDAAEIREPVPADVKVALYRIAQAAIDNAMRHSRSENIKVTLERVGTGLQLTVIDDGIGFDLKRESSSTWLGLVGMRERADAIGGHVTIDSTIDRGTIVTVVVPEILESPRE